MLCEKLYLHKNINNYLHNSREKLKIKLFVLSLFELRSMNKRERKMYYRVGKGVDKKRVGVKSYKIGVRGVLTTEL